MAVKSLNATYDEAGMLGGWMMRLDYGASVVDLSKKKHSITLKRLVMSRALDIDSVPSVQEEVSQQVYHEIVQALCSNPSERLEIEFLGKSHIVPPGCNILVDGNYIGISKPKLIQAFIVARKLFFKYLRDINNSDDQGVRNTTAVMLLMDAENLTAANARKKLIQRCKNFVDIESIIRKELIWVDGLLTSRLHRHTKSPTLWSHRRWLLDLGYSINMPFDIHSDLKEVILISAERHPRNYYAWQHLRWILLSSYGDNSPKRKITLDNEKLISTILVWCTKHPSDTSGFSFLLFCLSTLPEGSRPRIEVCSSACKDVLALANSFQWLNESVWVFLRTLVASGVVSSDQKAYFYTSIRAINASTEQAGSKRLLDNVEAWCRTNAETCHS